MCSKTLFFFLSIVVGIICNNHIAFAKALRSPLQTGDEIIVAKGDIPTPVKYHAAINGYLTFVQSEVDEMVLQLEILQKSAKEGRLQSAQDAYIQAHQHYERIRPIVILFGNTDRIINARADYFYNKEQDHRFVGFHLVEYQLFKLKNSKNGEVASDELLFQARDLQQRLQIETVEIPKLVQSSADFIEMILETKLAGKENIYSQFDIADMVVNVEGSEKIIKILSPFIATEVANNIGDNFANITQILNHYKIDNQQYRPYNQMTIKDKIALHSLLTQQAELLSTLRSQLSVDVYYKY